MSVTSQNRKYYWLSQRLTFSLSLFLFLSFYSITLYHFHLLPYFCWLLVARATCARKHINLIATICCLPAPLCVCYSLAVSHFGLFGIFGNKPLDFLCKWSKWQNATWLRCLFFPSCLNKLSAPRAPSPSPLPFANHAMCPFQCFCLSTSVSVRVFVDTWGRHTAKSAWQARSALQGVWGEGGAVVSLAAAVMHKFRVCYQI